MTGRTAGNGSLTRAAPVALTYLHDEAALVKTARTISELTHFDPEAGDACVLWCTAIRHAVLSGHLDVRIGLDHIDIARRDLWASRLNDAEELQPSAFATNNGWVVAALQAAWSAIVNTPVPVEDAAAGVLRVDHLRSGLEAAVRGGEDTDAVAASASALLGAVHAASPVALAASAQGLAGFEHRGLVQLADKIIDKGDTARFDISYGAWRGVPKPAHHPHDDGVWLGAAAGLHKLPAGVDAVVSLCGASTSIRRSRTCPRSCRMPTRPRLPGGPAPALPDPRHRSEGSAMSRNSDGGPQKPSTRWSAGASNTWGPYWDVLFPPATVTSWINWKLGSTGVNIAGRFWEQCEYRGCPGLRGI